RQPRFVGGSAPPSLWIRARRKTLLRVPAPLTHLMTIVTIRFCYMTIVIKTYRVPDKAASAHSGTGEHDAPRPDPVGGPERTDRRNVPAFADAPARSHEEGRKRSNRPQLREQDEVRRPGHRTPGRKVQRPGYGVTTAAGSEGRTVVPFERRPWWAKPVQLHW